MYEYGVYSECIAISQDAISFNVEIYCNCQNIGKANVLITRNLQHHSICFGLQVSDIDEDKIGAIILQHCKKRYSSILVEEKES